MAKIAYWVDMGTIRYMDAVSLYQRILPFRYNNKIPDTIITAEHFPEVNFGASEEHNKFNGPFIKDVESEFGSYSEENAAKLLQKRNISFSRSRRGGGATTVAPGQITFYPVVEFGSVIPPSRDGVKREGDVTGYKRFIDQIIFNVISHFDVPNLEIASGFHTSVEGEVRERRDVWTRINGKEYKIGSKGLQPLKNFSAGGFVIYAHKEGTELFDLVHACGYDPDEVGVISIEEVTRIRPDKELIKTLTKKELQKAFQYDEVKELKSEELISMIEALENKAR